MEAHGTDIPVRVSHLEDSVGRLHADNQRTQAALAGLSAQLTEHGKTLSDVAAKLDHQRTRRPEWIPLLTMGVSGIMMLLAVGALSFAPVYRDQGHNREYHTAASELFLEHAEQISSLEARTDNAEEMIRHLHDDIARLRDD